MSSDQPFNELGQILASGGEIALGLAISRGWSDRQIALLFARRFEPMREEDRERLVTTANRMVEAARYLNDIGDDDEIQLGNVPINPYLFGINPGGARAKVAYRFSVDEGVNWFDGRIDAHDLSSKAALFDLIEEQINIDFAKYPEGGGSRFGGAKEHLTIEVTITERRF